jgi:hypothetical protein
MSLIRCRQPPLQPMPSPASEKHWQHKDCNSCGVLSSNVPGRLTCMHVPEWMPAAAAAARAVSSVREKGELYISTELRGTPACVSCCSSSCLHRQRSSKHTRQPNGGCHVPATHTPCIGRHNSSKNSTGLRQCVCLCRANGLQHEFDVSCQKCLAVPWQNQCTASNCNLAVLAASASLCCQAYPAAVACSIPAAASPYSGLTPLSIELTMIPASFALLRPCRKTLHRAPGTESECLLDNLLALFMYGGLPGHMMFLPVCVSSIHCPRLSEGRLKEAQQHDLC